MEALNFRACAYLDKYIYFYTLFEGLPCRVNIETGKTELIEANGVSGLKKVDYISDMISCDNKIYAFTNSGDGVVEYNPGKNEMTEIPLKCEYFPWWNYALITPYKSNLYIFPRGKKEIVILDCRLRKWQRKNIDVCNIDIFQRGCVSGECAWLFPQCGNKIVKIDLKSMLVEEIEIKIDANDFVHVTEYDGNVYILTRDASIYVLNTKDKRISLVSSCLKQEALVRIFATKNSIILLPGTGDDIWTINLESGEVKPYHDYPKDFKYTGDEMESKYVGWSLGDNNTAYFAMMSSNYILGINSELGDISWIKPQSISLEEKINFFCKYAMNPILEEKNYLEAFLTATMNTSQSGTFDSPNIGKMIWKEMK